MDQRKVKEILAKHGIPGGDAYELPKVPFRHPAGGGAVVLGEGLLWLLSRMREAGDLPEDVVFKVSVFAGHGNPAGQR
ncbi:hypothetical protein J7K76_07280 [Candidatus Bipolaricaulota bacterium]|nr:hypothetical protein [Candidatus Bipolaricaulota bacterium]